MTGRVEPGVVDGAGYAARLLICPLEQFQLLHVVLRLVVDGRNGGKDGDGASFMRFTDVVKVFHASELLELAWDGRPGIVGLLPRVLLFEGFNPLLFFPRFELFGEHLEQGALDGHKVDVCHALEVEDTRGRVLLVDE